MDYYDGLAVIILAAGKGTRMKSDIPKVLHKVGGRAMVNHVIETSLQIVRNNVHVVIGHMAAMVQEEISQFFQVGFVHQNRLLGTGDAVKTALPSLDSSVRDVLVLCGDVPLIKAETLRRLVDVHRKDKAGISVLATEIPDPSGYGRIIMKDDNEMVAIREEADASEEEKKIKKINTGIYCFDHGLLSCVIDKITPENNQKEYYLTDAIELAKLEDTKISIVTINEPMQVIGVNTLEELDQARKLLARA
jgi:bifunctional UDP-N-acetylglucosamine pyrophosphorylase/glucosamine-1-phosphate N-acetyltransferase/UDP-N-acetylglucosamine pyrophosphorylase